MFMIIPVLLAILAGYLRGGRLRSFARLRLYSTWIPLVMFALQLSLVSFPVSQNEALDWLRPWITTATYAVLVVFLLANHRLPGFKLILLGTILNIAIILANGGYMPVTHEALQRSGHLDRMVVRGDQVYVTGSKDIVLGREETRLHPLSDVMGIPEALPLSATFSAGDVVIMFGAFWFAYRTMVQVPTPRRLTTPFLLMGAVTEMHEAE